MEQFALDAITRVTTAPPEVYDTISVDPLTPTIGAEVSGVDFSKELTEDQVAEVRRAFLRHQVLVFRDQELDNETHKRAAGYFGELHPVALPAKDSDPHVLEISADKDSRNVAGHGWHADGTADLQPSLGSMLYITRTPEVGSGGDTMFANMTLAYDMLSPAMKEMLDGMTAVHDGLLAWEGKTPPPEYDVPKHVHPVIARHPETGRKLLFVNNIYVSHIEQLSRRESRAVINMLCDHIASTALLHCRVRWTANTLVFWDNRCVQHHAIWDYFPHSRYGRRVAIKGHRPTA
ncbi:TauD/TfdA dioxygenase family protein [Streptomyces sp. NPDC050504]|uniref:TauD/TfdA dioxygenase family protein n=1 Tax=Streptomyces sp. NPDC050504 TaxID=3365618 RepID=UPI0037874825